jgi:hypothetical protein
MEAHAPHQSASPGLSVGACNVQTADDRFGDGGQEAVLNRERAAFGQLTSDLSTPFIWPNTDSDTEETKRSIYGRTPVMQAHRNNLTALSQMHNLYFVAYQGHIFVYRPRSVPMQALPAAPDLQLNIKPSQVARAIGGALDPYRPHTINHIVVGLFGKEEAVVACYDDGDVVAYYVKDIELRVSSKLDHSSLLSQPILTDPLPILHENVGTSAWGLAVHGRSRLIAVSSNHREVTVFVPALGDRPSEDLDEEDNGQVLEFLCDIGLRVKQRARNWRIIIALGPGANNIPNISFMDDHKGEADKICAIDINAVVWIASIWEPNKKPTRMPGYRTLESEESPNDPSR